MTYKLILTTDMDNIPDSFMDRIDQRSANMENESESVILRLVQNKFNCEDEQIAVTENETAFWILLEAYLEVLYLNGFIPKNYLEEVVGKYSYSGVESEEVKRYKIYFYYSCVATNNELRECIKILAERAKHVK